METTKKKRIQRSKSGSEAAVQIYAQKSKNEQGSEETNNESPTC